MDSSYAENSFGAVFLAIMDAFKPHRVVELGCLHGYSTKHLAEGMKRYGGGAMDVFDMFEDYQYKHGTQSEVQKLMDEGGYDFVKLNKGDAFEAYKKFPDNSVSMLHVDLSNTGDTVKNIMRQWHPKMVQGGVILFEGGSKERDGVSWMKTYSKPSIKDELEANELIRSNYVFGTYFKYPSLTMLLKRR